MEPLQYTAEQLSTKATYAASGATALLGAWSAEVWGIVIGAVISLAALGLNAFFQIRRDRRDRERLCMDREEHRGRSSE